MNPKHTSSCNVFAIHISDQVLHDSIFLFHRIRPHYHFFSLVFCPFKSWNLVTQDP